MDLFKNKDVSPMLLESQEKPFDDDNYIFELKLDGIRCIAYLDDKTSLRNKKNVELLPIYPELTFLYKQVKDKCVLDGELVVLNEDGSPNFFLLQKRSLLTDKFKIELESKRHSVQFVAYDILQKGERAIVDLPLFERKKILDKVVKEGGGLSVSRIVEGKGKTLFSLTKKLGLEGIVAKDKNSAYEIGKRSKSWIKIKNLKDEDFMICGIVLGEEGKIKDLILGQYKKDKLTFRGKVFVNISKQEEGIILAFALKHQTKPLFMMKGDIVWIKPELVCTAQYTMLTRDGAMRQPVFKGLRYDK